MRKTDYILRIPAFAFLCSAPVLAFTCRLHSRWSTRGISECCPPPVALKGLTPIQHFLLQMDLCSTEQSSSTVKHCCSSVHTLTLTHSNGARPRGFTSAAHVCREEVGEHKPWFEQTHATLLEVCGVLFKSVWAAQQIDAVGGCASSLFRSDWTVTCCSRLATAWYIRAGLGLSLFCLYLSLSPSLPPSLCTIFLPPPPRADWIGDLAVISQVQYEGWRLAGVRTGLRDPSFVPCMWLKKATDMLLVLLRWSNGCK